MAKRRARLSDLRILLSNDDGIDSPGLKALERVARTISKDVWVVAPQSEQSGAAHSLTLTEPLRIRKISARRFAVDGTPTDAVLMAFNHIVKGKRPSLLMSGINRGANLGEDVTYSGTVAAAMEGALLGIPSIALSQVFRFPHPVKWATAEHHAPALIRKLLRIGWQSDVLINVNFPNTVASQVMGLQVTVQGRRDAADLVIDDRVDARGVPYYWIGFRRHFGAPPRGTDLAAITEHAISVTPLHLDLTHGATRRALRAAFK